MGVFVVMGPTRQDWLTRWCYQVTRGEGCWSALLGKVFVGYAEAWHGIWNEDRAGLTVSRHGNKVGLGCLRFCCIQDYDGMKKDARGEGAVGLHRLRTAIIQYRVCGLYSLLCRQCICAM